MQRAESGPAERIRRRRRLVGIGVAVLVLVLLGVVVAVAVTLSLRGNTRTFKETFVARCEDFNGTDCEKIWGLFEEAYVGRDPCKVPVAAYGPLIAAAPFPPKCNQRIFWSKTKAVVHDFTKKRKCFETVEDTLLGSVLDGQTWCGKEGSNETFATGCPGWTDCETSAVRSFWNGASAAFADAACGDVTVMLNGAVATPFYNKSVFATIEVPRFRSPKVRSLKVVLVTQENSLTSCENESLKDLQRKLDGGITYSCKAVPEAQINDCIPDPEKGCPVCW
uniref:ADP-ribosyl cyclase/cyclic ADP-ribose hydrolase n=1 Tax=Gasterosteus aculeatus aculeatus TaxID=481459 RepID=G3NMH1_GASAC